MANPPTHSDEKSTKEVLDELSINTCCDDACIDCIIDGACHTESGCRDDCGGPHGNPVFTRCDGDDCEPPCPRECWSCGPLQIKEEYWEDAQWHCGFNSSSPIVDLILLVHVVNCKIMIGNKHSATVEFLAMNKND